MTPGIIRSYINPSILARMIFPLAHCFLSYSKSGKYISCQCRDTNSSSLWNLFHQTWLINVLLCLLYGSLAESRVKKWTLLVLLTPDLICKSSPLRMPCRWGLTRPKQLSTVPWYLPGWYACQGMRTVMATPRSWCHGNGRRHLAFKDFFT